MNNKKILFITEIYPSGLTGTSVKARTTLTHLLRRNNKIDVLCTSPKELKKNILSHKNLKIFCFKGENRNNFSLFPSYIASLFNLRLKSFFNQIQQKRSYDYILFNEYSTLQYISKKQSNYIYLDDEDITDLFYKRFKTEENLFPKLSFFVDFLKSVLFERRYLNKVGYIWAISKRTKKRLSQISKAKFSVIPTIVKLQKNIFRVKNKNIVFVGTLDWEENKKGLEWFLKTSWTEIKKEFPQIKFFIVGQNPGLWLRIICQKDDNIILKGYVKDLNSVFSQSALAISPVFINSGIKVKNLTYLSYGLPVVAIKESLWGMPSKQGVVEANKDNFSKKISSLLKDNKKRKKLSQQAIENIKKNHSEETLESFFDKQKL
jgi:polysaccharide biosynthesis protein PslH